MRIPRKWSLGQKVSRLVWFVWATALQAASLWLWFAQYPVCSSHSGCIKTCQSRQVCALWQLMIQSAHDWKQEKQCNMCLERFSTPPTFIAARKHNHREKEWGVRFMQEWIISYDAHSTRYEYVQICRRGCPAFHKSHRWPFPIAKGWTDTFPGHHSSPWKGVIPSKDWDAKQFA